MSVEAVEKAIADNNYADFRRALDTGVPPETRVLSHWGETLLGYACFHKRERMIYELLNRGADPNATDKDGYNALKLLIFGIDKDSDIVPSIRLLINAGADPLQKSSGGASSVDTIQKSMAGIHNSCAILEALQAPPDGKGLSPLQVTFNRKVGNKDIEEIYLFDTLERISLLHPNNSKTVEAMSCDNFSALSQKSLLREAFDEHVRRGGTVPETEVFGMTNFGFGFEKSPG